MTDWRQEMNEALAPLRPVSGVADMLDAALAVAERMACELAHAGHIELGRSIVERDKLCAENERLRVAAALLVRSFECCAVQVAQGLCIDHINDLLAGRDPGDSYAAALRAVELNERLCAEAVRDSEKKGP